MIAKALLFIFSLYFVFCGAIAKADTGKVISVSEIRTQATKTYSYDFGAWPVHSRVYADIYVLNDGDRNLSIDDVFVWGPSYSAIRHCPAQIRSGYRCLVRVFFEPWAYGMTEGQVSIHTDRGLIAILLYGTGV